MIIPIAKILPHHSPTSPHHITSHIALPLVFAPPSHKTLAWALALALATTEAEDLGMFLLRGHHNCKISLVYFYCVIFLSTGLLFLETDAWVIWGSVGSSSSSSSANSNVAASSQVPRSRSNVNCFNNIIKNTRRHRLLVRPLYFSENKEEGKGEGEKEEDWRDVRAKLIQQYRSGSSSSSSPSSSSTAAGTTETDEASSSASPETTSTANSTSTTTTTADVPPTTTAAPMTPTTTKKWAYDSGDVVERGSLIVSHPVQDFACGGLKQQYFHKCVVLVVKHDAHFTKGVILNRPTRRSKLKDLHGNEWTVWFAGDVQGLHSPHPDYTCLHRLKSPKALELSLPVVKDIQHTTWELAQMLVQQGEARPEDFWLGCGYAGWWPQQLQDELERGNWFMVATDSQSISELIVNSHSSTTTTNAPADDNEDEEAASEGGDATGTAMWKDFMGRISKDHLIEEYSKQQEFEDIMLNEWVKERLMPSKLEQAETERKNNGLIIQPHDDTPATPVVQEGTVYRTSHRILLDEQVFHQSLVLILKCDERGIIGAILNRPSSKDAVLKKKKLPLRYGGRYGLGGEGKPETWLHCGNQALRSAKVGVPVVPEDESLVWQCTREDAETAVEIGLASPSDFMAVLGLTLWEKNPPPEGFGVPLTKTNLAKDFVPVPKSAIPHLWKELLKQEVLTEDSLAKNLEHSKSAYLLASNGETSSGKDTPGLADDALVRWIKMFLMDKDGRAEGIF